MIVQILLHVVLHMFYVQCILFDRLTVHIAHIGETYRGGMYLADMSFIFWRLLETDVAG